MNYAGLLFIATDEIGVDDVVGEGTGSDDAAGLNGLSTVQNGDDIVIPVYWYFCACIAQTGKQQSLLI